MPRSKNRGKSSSRQARETQVAQEQSKKKKLTPQQYMRRRALGWTLIAVGISFAVTHWLAHLGVLYEDRPLWDLMIGYPMAGLLAIGGAIVLSD